MGQADRQTDRQTNPVPAVELQGCHGSGLGVSRAPLHLGVLGDPWGPSSSSVLPGSRVRTAGTGLGRLCQGVERGPGGLEPSPEKQRGWNSLRGFQLGDKRNVGTTLKKK